MAATEREIFLPRDDLATFLPNPRAIDAFEAQFSQVQDNTGAATNAQNTADTAIAATASLSAATYVTLSNDSTLTAERVLTAGNLIVFTDTGPGGTLTIKVDKLTIAGAFTVALTLTANSALTLPTTGTLGTLAGVETFSNKTLDTLRVNDAFNASVPVGAGTVPILVNNVVKYIVLSNTP
jgi:hypothetical protein